MKESLALMTTLPDALKNRETPFRLFDLAVIKENYEIINNTIQNVSIHYAVKVESHPEILKFLQSLGSSFDVASPGEIDMALEAGALPHQISYSNPVKKPEYIAEAYAKGVRLFTADEYEELDKIAEFAPNSEVFIRLTIPSLDSIESVHPMTSKFGAEPEKVKDLLMYAHKKGLIPYGISFHVGSQCTNKLSWLKPLNQSAEILKNLYEEGIKLKSINVGGGFPTRYQEDVPACKEICMIIDEFIQAELSEFDLNVCVEPGRVIVADAAALITRINLRSEKRGQTWLHLDGGLYQGLAELFWGFEYRTVALDKTGTTQTYSLAGPTCDGYDVLSRGTLLPENLTTGDTLCIYNVGAYAGFISDTFNGFKPCPVYFL